MSDYMYFYARKDDTFICLNYAYSSSAIYKVFNYLIQYDAITNIDLVIDSAKTNCREIIDKLTQKRKELKRKIAAITQTNSPIEEKMRWMDRYYQLLNNTKQELDEYKNVLYFCSFLEDILVCNRGPDEKPILYAGIGSGNEITLEDIEEE